MTNEFTAEAAGDDEEGARVARQSWREIDGVWEGQRLEEAKTIWGHPRGNRRKVNSLVFAMQVVYFVVMCETNHKCWNACQLTLTNLGQSKQLCKVAVEEHAIASASRNAWQHARVQQQRVLCSSHVTQDLRCTSPCPIHKQQVVDMKHPLIH